MPTSPAAAAAEVSRQCSNCERTLPLTAENFYNDEPRCRSCANARHYRGRRFGVEIEFVGLGRHSAISALRAARVPVADTRDYTHEVMDEWKVVTDGSVNGYELVSPPLRGKAGIRQVERACRALRNAGARVDHSCGIHVHFEVRDLSARAFGRFFRLWMMNQTQTDELVAPSRRNSRWAQRLHETEVERIESVDLNDPEDTLNYLDRYRALNARCFPRYGTVEVRQHQGSLDSKKIVAWIEFGKALISVAKSADALPNFSSAAEMVEALVVSGGLPATASRFLAARAVTLAGGREVAARRQRELEEQGRQAAEREALAQRQAAERAELDRPVDSYSRSFSPRTYTINTSF